MVLLIGACLLAAGIIGALTVVFTFDSGPDWLSLTGIFATWLLIPGIILTLVGLGMFLGHPHIWRF
jgi:hypothetical protein